MITPITNGCRPTGMMIAILVPIATATEGV